MIAWLGIEPQIPRRGEPEGSLGKLRCYVERTLSWLNQFYRLRIRWDHRPEIHQAFFSLAAAVVRYRLWINES